MESIDETTTCDGADVVRGDAAAEEAAAGEDFENRDNSSPLLCLFSSTSNSTAVNPESDLTIHAFSPSIEVRASLARHPPLHNDDANVSPPPLAVLL